MTEETKDVQQEVIVVEKEKATDVSNLSQEELIAKVNEEGAVYGEYIDYKKASPKQIVDWFVDNRSDISPTDVVRKWVFASIPCKICGRKPEEIVEPGEPMFVISYLNYGVQPGRAIRFFCRDHAQIVQDEMVSRGIEIVTEEQRQEILDKLNMQFAVLDESIEPQSNDNIVLEKVDPEEI